MNPRDVRRLARRTNGIHGWFSREAAGLFALLDEVQRAHGIAGDLFEIGVHHGKSAVLLGNLAGPEETVGVCDIFGGQSDNVSVSGVGDRGIFESNMATYAPGTRVQVFEKLSSQLTPDEIPGPYRLFHVDGGHLVDEARMDMELGVAVLAEGGVIVVDDPFRPEWPGVTEAILAFCDAHDDFTPIALGFNKLVLAKTDFAPLYARAIEGDRIWAFVNHRVFERKTLPIKTHDVPIFLVPTYRQAEWLHRPVAEARTLASRVRKVIGLLPRSPRRA
jgi:hypothetical protein